MLIDVVRRIGATLAKIIDVGPLPEFVPIVCVSREPKAFVRRQMGR